MIMSWTWTTLAVFAFLFLLQAFLWKRNAKAKRLPPGPRGIAVDLSAKVGALNADMTCRMVFGKKYMEKEFDERGFKDVMEEVMELLATINLADYIPQIASLDLQGLRKRMKVVSKVFDEFLEKIIDEHDMLGAAMDTSASSIEWVLSEQMNKLQNELENVLCKDRKVEESDLDNLEYLDILDIVAKET
ncbi:hypothetical protein JRO89_XS08G0023600 [Xanthoceras sorbifolium]|uniref:Cytochrome P450 n=1 Tax=Xanthoceras sorbifolium TaxID=99658 RepID=A0ABQ8HNC8_9ROSI|nr:hypothetical protein JRO89_XS08G0023600 [Xanthoceras sorbifolium]